MQFHRMSKQQHVSTEHEDDAPPTSEGVHQDKGAENLAPAAGSADAKRFACPNCGSGDLFLCVPFWVGDMVDQASPHDWPCGLDPTPALTLT